jgi:hypothetical protein
LHGTQPDTNACSHSIYVDGKTPIASSPDPAPYMTAARFGLPPAPVSLELVKRQPRETRRFRDLYAGRSVVEREFGRSKHEYGRCPSVSGVLSVSPSMLIL